jgi:pyruvate formate lyase activating enzyme
MRSSPAKATTLAEKLFHPNADVLQPGIPGLEESICDSTRAVILNLQRLSTEDGPGIRTTVFFKGCPLSCAWCHNPESIARGFQVQWLQARCIGCHTCLRVCPEDCLEFTAAGLVIDRAKCTRCLACSEACPANAMEQLGRHIALPELVAELVKDRSFYESSSGGVTASGGEPTLQAEFVRSLFFELKELGIHTALDTCGLTKFHTLESLLPWTDLILFDLKELDPHRHRKYTGSSSQLILSNLVLLVEMIRERGLPVKVWIRTPLIPGATATAENIFNIAEFIRTKLAGRIERWELCAFNNLCRDKFARLDLPWLFEGAPLLEQSQTDELLQIARGCGLDAQNVSVTGAIKS